MSVRACVEVAVCRGYDSNDETPERRRCDPLRVPEVQNPSANLTGGDCRQSKSRSLQRRRGKNMGE